ncbi:redox-sensing transcriptional repressor Rex [Aminivibrio sp.]|jgi:redox-sensing transcriptional repressor|uniref:redox-sensing transcriptional repressor Rex n=1 Tax=Aminivibrio sp. TaxID=1872489 RepID=UPI001A51DD6E|nr:redox-sensing transcriptional repressor Rex [Aminivibrio sp.]MBL3539089.1 redox-sensing transcriptional repressor Rex [Aminivibrio sp.]MDK2959500.1 redox-sensing transcriptional repressor [Synergistaceae bacterium]
MKIAEPTIERLVQYQRLLEQLVAEGQKVVSSQEMGEMLSFKASQVRKDLSYFGEIGKRGVGYHVDRLHKHISRILASPRKWSIGLVGVGKLGEALLGYQAFRNDKFRIRALFDVDTEKIGKEIQGIPCYSAEDIAEIVREKEIEVLILTVPGGAAQHVVDKAAEAGTVKGILNFAPVSLSVPENVLLAAVDISVELEKLLFFLKHKEE